MPGDDGFGVGRGKPRAAMRRPESLLLGKDREALEILIALHAAPAPEILDCTHNAGFMWEGCSYKPSVTMDVDPAHGTDVVGDFRDMPFPDAFFDVIVFDPPHMVDAPNSKMAGSYGLGTGELHGAGKRHGYNVCDYFAPFLTEAQRVLKPGGVVLAKIADMVHNHKYQWQHVEFVNEAVRLGMTPCDLMVKSDQSAGKIRSRNWKSIKHLRKNHSYWIVVRNSRKCER